ncbi:hypothetical protein HaLaN_15903 [Haematococcus lacustris]|uniref:Uncharacterized protein n=1 Tax=Haematococcus lacustris TaxID=44745 RepID=A0A699Z8N5_HAELA|nr:hypothetical protein HaLaN_15903 [Haematococcus lacustris]
MCPDDAFSTNMGRHAKVSMLRCVMAIMGLVGDRWLVAACCLLARTIDAPPATVALDWTVTWGCNASLERFVRCPVIETTTIGSSAGEHLRPPPSRPY